MAKEFTLSAQIFVIDTSYLVELFKVPGHSKPTSVKEVKKKHEMAIESEGRLYVPFPCIIELGNHIAGVSNGNKRTQIAKLLRNTIKSSVNDFFPWNITPVYAIKSLPEATENWLSKFVKINLSLTDSFVVQEAKRLKKKYNSFGFKIHIWTMDWSLKSHEPDKEKNAYL